MNREKNRRKNPKRKDLPSSPLPVISNIIPCIRMHQRAQRPPPNHQPRNKGPKLRRREDIHLEHPDRVRAYGSLEQRVDSQFGEFPPDPLVQFARVGYLCGRGLLEVDVDVEAAPRAVCYGGGEGGVGRGFCCWGRVGEGFGVWAGGFLGAGSKGWLVGFFFLCFFGGFGRGKLGLTLGEVGGSRSLRGGMGICRGLGRTLFGC